jgi:hypothetical protein
MQCYWPPMKSPGVSSLSKLCLVCFAVTQVVHAQTPTTPSGEAVAPAPVVVKTGPLTSIWTKQDRLNDGLFYYPDMPIGVIRTLDRSQYLFFAPGTGLNQATQTVCSRRCNEKRLFHGTRNRWQFNLCRHAARQLHCHTPGTFREGLKQVCARLSPEPKLGLDQIRG